TAFIPTDIIGFALYHVEADNAVADVDAISYKQAALIGLFQSISMIPGGARAGATIVGGLILGLSRSTIVEFAFLLAVPTMLAATLHALHKNTATFLPQ